MIQLKSVLTVADNSGAQLLSVVSVYGRQNRKTGGVSDIVTGVVKKADPNAAIKDGTLVKAVVVRTRKEKRRKDGSSIRFDDNAAVLIDNPKDRNPIGTRIFGPIVRELKDAGFNKIISMAQEVY